MHPNSRDLIPDLTKTEDSDACRVDTNTVRADEESLLPELTGANSPFPMSRTNTASSVSKTSPAGLFRRTDDAALSVVPENHGRAYFDPSTGPSKPSGGTFGPRLTIRASDSGACEKVGLLDPKTREPTDDDENSVHNDNSTTTGKSTTAAATSSGSSWGGPPLPTESELFNLNYSDFEKAIPMVVNGNDLLPTADDANWDTSIKPPSALRCSCSARSSDGGTVTVCSCKNITGLNEFIDSFARVNAKRLTKAERLRAFAYGLANASSDPATDVTQMSIASNTGSTSGAASILTSSPRKRKSISPLDHPTTPKRKINDNGNNRKRKSDDYDDAPPAKKPYCPPALKSQSRKRSSSPFDSGITKKRLASTPKEGHQTARRLFESPELSPILRTSDSTNRSPNAPALQSPEASAATAASPTEDDLTTGASPSDEDLTTAASPSEEDLTTARAVTPPPMPIPQPVPVPAPVPVAVALAQDLKRQINKSLKDISNKTKP